MSEKTAGLYRRVADEFQKEFLRVAQAAFEGGVSRHVQKENRQEFQHGAGWAFEREDATPAEQTFSEHTAQMILKAENLLASDFTVLPTKLRELIADMVGSFEREMYRAVGDAADSVGNTVSAAGKTFPQAFLESLSRIEFAVGPDGRVHLPEVHVHPSQAARLLNELEMQGPEYKAEVERIKAQKTADALAREHARVAKFRTR